MQSIENNNGENLTLPMDVASIQSSDVNGMRTLLIPQVGTESRPSYDSALAAANNGTSNPMYIYALGKVEARFPSLAVEKEFMQATGRAETTGQTNQHAFHTVLAERSNRYLARQLCWVLMIEGLETYILAPRDPADLDLLIEAVRPQPSPLDVDVVIGVRGPIASPAVCNGLMVPIVVFDQIYSFDAPTLIQAIPKPERLSAEQFGPAAEELFYRILQMADNAGATDEHRALNYLVMRYDAIYATAADMFGRNLSLTAIEVVPSRLSGTRRIVDVIFSFTHRETLMAEKYFVRTDVTEMWPFLITRMSPYFDR